MDKFFCWHGTNKQKIPLLEIEWQFHITKRVLPNKIYLNQSEISKENIYGT